MVTHSRHSFLTIAFWIQPRRLCSVLWIWHLSTWSNWFCKTRGTGTVSCSEESFSSTTCIPKVSIPHICQPFIKRWVAAHNCKKDWTKGCWGSQSCCIILEWNIHVCMCPPAEVSGQECHFFCQYSSDRSLHIPQCTNLSPHLRSMWKQLCVLFFSQLVTSKRAWPDLETLKQRHSSWQRWTAHFAHVEARLAWGERILVKIPKGAFIDKWRQSLSDNSAYFHVKETWLTFRKYTRLCNTHSHT